MMSHVRQRYSRLDGYLVLCGGPDSRCGGREWAPACSPQHEGNCYVRRRTNLLVNDIFLRRTGQALDGTAVRLSLGKTDRVCGSEMGGMLGGSASTACPVHEPPRPIGDENQPLRAMGARSWWDGVANRV